jgi:AcrR family transcriptional regulator
MALGMAPSREYQSPLREAYAAQTRERIIAAALKYLESNESDTLTLHRIADLAGVSKPTVYAHFPTLDDLYLGIYHSLQPRLRLQPDNYPSGLDKLADIPASNFPAYARYGKAVRAVVLAPGFHRARRSNRPERLQRWVDRVEADVPELAPAERRLGAIAVNAFWLPSMWHWLSETCGLSTEEAIRVASWATDHLVQALKKDAKGLKADAARELRDKPAKERPPLKKRGKRESDR